MALPDDLWRECAAWLTRCKIIPADHRYAIFVFGFFFVWMNFFLGINFRANWSSSEIKILALTLRDGVLLCNLLHFLDPTEVELEPERRPREAQVSLLLHLFSELKI